MPPTCVVISAATSIAGVTEAVEAMAQGSSGVALQLNGQFSEEALDALQESGHRLGLAYIADPSADLASACHAFSGGRVPLALSAHRYEMPELVAAMTTGGVQVLLIDPVAIGGPHLVRALAILAELCGIEVAIDATGHDERGAVTAGGIAATLEPCTRPLLVDCGCRCPHRPERPALDEQAARQPCAAHRPHHAAPCLGADAPALCQRHVYAPHHRTADRRDRDRRRSARLWRDQRHDRCRPRRAPRWRASWPGAVRSIICRCAGAAWARSTASRNGLRDWSAWAGLEMALLDWRGRHFGEPFG